MPRKRPTAKQKLLAEKILENLRSDTPKTIGELMREVGYSKSISTTPSQITSSKSFTALLDKAMPDDDLTNTHAKLLGSKRLDSKLFPSGITDNEITDMLESAGCVVKNIYAADNGGRRAYYIVPNEMVQQNALKLGYEVKKKIAKDDPVAGDFNLALIVQKNNFNPKSRDLQEVNEELTKMMMEAYRTKNIIDVEGV